MTPGGLIRWNKRKDKARDAIDDVLTFLREAARVTDGDQLLNPAQSAAVGLLEDAAGCMQGAIQLLLAASEEMNRPWPIKVAAPKEPTK